jgi:hypothetical protein
MVADDLRRQADHFVDLVDLQPLIAREGVPPRENNYRQNNHHQSGPYSQNYTPQPVSLDGD